jgi:hypothetical protein
MQYPSFLHEDVEHLLQAAARGLLPQAPFTPLL